MRRNMFGLYLQELLDAPGDGGAGGGAGAGAGAGGDAGAGGSGSGGSGAVDGKAPNTAGAGGKSTGNPWDAEKRGFISDLQKERQQRQELERRIAAAEAERDTERNRVRALTGVNTPSKDEAARAAVREEIGNMYPVLKGLNEEQLTKVLTLAEKADSLEQAVNHHWTQHAQSMIDNAYKGVEKAIGGKLSERQQKALGQLYLAEAANNPEFLKRHNASDPTLTEEFVKQFIEDWFEPARRSAIAEQTKRQRPVPDGKGRSPISVGGKKIEIKTDKDFADAMAGAYVEQGGRFGE